MTCIELFLNADFYSKHPILENVVESSMFQSVECALKFCVSDDSFNAHLSSSDLVKREAFNNCFLNSWSSFLCLLGAASVICRPIQSLYPDIGYQKYKQLFNSLIIPREFSENIDTINILFCRDGPMSSKLFRPNHFVPLLTTNDDKITMFLSEKEPPKKKQCLIQFPTLTPTNTNVSYARNIKISTIKAVSSVHTKKQSISKIPCVTINNFLQPSKISRIVSPNNDRIKCNTNQLPTASSDATIETINLPDTVENNNATIDNDINSESIAIENKYDVGNYLDIATRSLSNTEIFDLINNVFVPDSKYNFPLTNKRKFKINWFKRFHWLAYSPKYDGAFCLTCVMFGHKIPTNVSVALKNLFKQPFRSWSKANEAFEKHEGSHTSCERNFQGLHSRTLLLSKSFFSEFSGKSVPINVQLNNEAQARHDQFKNSLFPIVDTVALCGRMGIALRGHRDDFKYHSEPGEYCKGEVGNFIRLINFAIRHGDKTLDNHLKSCPKNATYLSKSIQNEIIQCCGEVILNDIISSVKQAKYFSVIADEAHDLSNKELMSVVLRYLDPEFNIKEDFVGYVHLVEGMSGENIANAILTFIDSLGLDIANCRGQGYDGAGAMAGKIKGCSSRILRINNKAIYTHCYCHRLNLSVCSALNVSVVKDLFQYIKDISYFFNFCESRQQMLDRNIEEYSPDSSKRKLKDICRTRWVERIEGLDVFYELFVPLFHTFQEMSTNANGKCNDKTRVGGGYYFNAISNFKFIVCLVVTKNILDLCLPTTRALQASAMDILCALELITSLKNLTMKMRSDADDVHKSWYNQALSLAEKIDVDESKPRSCGIQRNRDNTPYNTISDYYRGSITIPVLDNFCIDICKRFSNDALTVYQGLSILPERITSQKTMKSSSSWKEQFDCFSRFYISDFPSPECLSGELKVWENDWKTSKIKPPESIAMTLKLSNFEGYTNIKEALKILATIPVTSCECERSFSALKLLKTYNRTTMLTERLNGLALLYVHQESKPNVEKIVQHFMQMKERRIKC